MPKTGQKQGGEKRRDPKTGKFLPGNRSGGRPAMSEELREAFRGHGKDALDTLVGILTDPEAKDSDRIRAAEVILDRGWGKPVQAVDLDTSLVPQVVFLGVDSIAE